MLCLSDPVILSETTKQNGELHSKPRNTHKYYCFSATSIFPPPSTLPTSLSFTPTISTFQILEGSSSIVQASPFTNPCQATPLHSNSRKPQCGLSRGTRPVIQPPRNKITLHIQLHALILALVMNGQWKDQHQSHLLESSQRSHHTSNPDL